MKDTIIRIMCIALPVIAACSVNADTKYWKSSPSNANLNDITNWESDVTSFATADTYMIRSSSDLPEGAYAWTLSDNLTFGTFATTKEIMVDLAGKSLTVGKLLSRGSMTFTNGTLTANSASSECGINQTSNNCHIVFSEGVTFSQGAKNNIIIGNSGAGDVSNNGVTLEKGAKISDGGIALGYTSLQDGAVCTNNYFHITGSGSSANLGNLLYRCGSRNVVSVEDGAALTFTGGYVNIGQYDGSIGNTLLVTGAGSTFKSEGSSNGVRLGYPANTSASSLSSTDNRFVVSDGAIVSLGALNIGATSGSTSNVVTVVGSGSKITATGNTYIGGSSKTNTEGNRIEVLGGATYAGAGIHLGLMSDGCALVVSNATVTGTGDFAIGASNGGKNSVIDVAGASASISISGNMNVYNDQKMSFSLTSNTWQSEAPVNITGSSKKIVFKDTGTQTLEITVNAKHIEPGTYKLISTNGEMTSEDLAKITLSADSTGLVELVKTATSIDAKVKTPGLTVIFR